MQRLYRSILFVLGISLTSDAAIAQDGNDNNTVSITTTAVPFLRISPDARSGGLGDAGIGLSPDANSGFFNLAKIAFANDKAAIGATYAPWLKDVADDVYLGTLSGYYKLDEKQALAASLRYFSAGELDIVDFNGNKLNTANPREMAVDLGYARQLSDQFSIAGALRYIRSNLATGSVNGTSYKAGSAVAADLSFFYNGLNDKDRGWTAGITLSNLGSKIGYTGNDDQKDFLPANAGIGAAYKDAWDEDNKISFLMDINKLLVPETPQREEEMAAYRSKGVVESWFDSFGNKAWQFGFGMEYGYREQLYLRIGYNSKTYAYGSWQYLTTGVGLQFNMATVNFSYLVPTGDKVNRNPLSNTVRFGLLFKLK